MPFACMLLADLGAQVLRLDRADGGGLDLGGHNVLGRSRQSVAIDLRHEGAAETVLRLVERADVLIEGFRPGVTERLGIGPEPCLARNARLVYGRMTGWGQNGPLAARAGHDINYAGLTGALGAIGEPGRKPVPPLNLVADFGGGALYLVAGVLAALVERATSGRGQVVDAAMVDGTTSLLALFYGLRGGGLWRDERGTNLLDGGAPCYDTYECSDGEYVALGALEPQFWQEVVRVLGLTDAPDQWDMTRWPELRGILAAAFRTRTRENWAAAFADVDGCVSPVLSLGEAPGHPHLQARGTTIEVAGVVQPAPAPRFSRTPSADPTPAPPPGADTRAALQEWGFPTEEIELLLAAGVVTEP